MTIRAVVFDIGGILKIGPRGGDPTAQFPELIAQWEIRRGMQPGALDARLMAMDEQLKRAGKDGDIGTLSEAESRAELRLATGWEQEQVEAFMRDYWDMYCGQPNSELVTYFAGLRPRYQTALLSNSFVGARREEEDRYHFSAITDLIIYSHEAGVTKPDPRMFALTCERLDVEPGEMVFLDDVMQNIAAADAYGIHAVLYHDNAQAVDAIEALLAAPLDTGA